jgi:hypothetical protein
MNIATIEFNLPLQASIYHNDILIIDTVEGNCSLILDTLSVNKLCIANTSDEVIHVKTITMFDMGKDKLVYNGLCHDNDTIYQSQDIVPNATWILEYEYPVFAWLYKTLNLGWLVPFDPK